MICKIRVILFYYKKKPILKVILVIKNNSIKKREIYYIIKAKFYPLTDECNGVNLLALYSMNTK